MQVEAQIGWPPVRLVSNVFGPVFSGGRQVDGRQIGLSLALQELGVNSDVSEFDSRLILQKTVYLLQAAGIHLGYPFNWYLRGPYSPALTRDLYDQASNREDAEGWELDAKSRQVARELEPLVAGRPGETATAQARRLELAASLLYLAQLRRVNLDDVQKATEQLAHNGKEFPIAQVTGAIDDLRQIGLLTVSA